ncbi:MAG: Gfo/Idh/MocA family protein [Phycisphaerales bacterium JB039]
MTDLNRRTFIAQSAGALSAVALTPSLASAWRMPRGAALSVGVIGVGRQGRQILSELEKIDGVTLAAICDIDPSRLDSGQRRAQGARAFADHRALLDDPDIDAVIIATPTHTHREVAVDAISAGRHIYCEAPLAHTIEDCRAIASTARASAKVFQAGFQGRSNPVYNLARSFYRSDSVRDLVQMRAVHARKTSWRIPSPDPDRERALNWRLDPAVSLGLAGEWGAQQFDVFHWFTGNFPTRIRAGGFIANPDNRDGREIPDTIHATLEFPGGPTLVYQATLASSYEDEYELLCGTFATIKLAWSHGWMFKEADAPTQGWEIYANKQQFHTDEGITLIAEATKLAAQGRLQEGVGLEHPPLYYALQDFVKSCVEGAEVATSVEAGLRSTVVGILANRAVMTGEVVEVTQQELAVG